MKMGLILLQLAAFCLPALAEAIDIKNSVLATGKRTCLVLKDSKATLYRYSELFGAAELVSGPIAVHNEENNGRHDIMADKPFETFEFREQNLPLKNNLLIQEDDRQAVYENFDVVQACPFDISKALQR